MMLYGGCYRLSGKVALMQPSRSLIAIEGGLPACCVALGTFSLSFMIESDNDGI